MLYDEKIEALISAALADGVLTEKEKQILFKKAQAQGIDLDEFEMVLDARLVEIEKAEVMVPGDGSTPEIFAEFEEELGMKLEGTGRYEYYDLCASPDVYLAIQTGEQRTFSNILITIGCAWQ